MTIKNVFVALQISITGSGELHQLYKFRKSSKATEWKDNKCIMREPTDSILTMNWKKRGGELKERKTWANEQFSCYMRKALERSHSTTWSREISQPTATYPRYDTTSCSILKIYFYLCIKNIFERTECWKCHKASPANLLMGKKKQLNAPEILHDNLSIGRFFQTHFILPKFFFIWGCVAYHRYLHTSRTIILTQNNW